MKCLFTLFSLTGFLLGHLSTVLGQEAQLLHIEVSNIKTNRGLIRVAIYDSQESFLTEQVVRGAAFPVDRKGKALLSLDDLVRGAYAISIYHDKNSNGKLDNNIFGIPKEPYGFSNNAKKRFGPPAFKAARFSFLRSGQSISIRLK